VKEDCDDMKQKWTNYVAAIASKRQKLKTLNKPQELPLDRDLDTLTNFFKKISYWVFRALHHLK